MFKRPFRPTLDKSSCLCDDGKLLCELVSTRELAASGVCFMEPNFQSWQTTCKLAASICRQDFFIIINTTSTHSLVESFNYSLIISGDKYHIFICSQWRTKIFKVAEQSDDCSVKALLARCAIKVKAPLWRYMGRCPSRYHDYTHGLTTGGIDD